MMKMASIAQAPHCPLSSHLAVLIDPGMLPLRMAVDNNGCNTDDSFRAISHLICSLLLLTESVKGLSLDLSSGIDLKPPVATRLYDNLLHRAPPFILDFRAEPASVHCIFSNV